MKYHPEKLISEKNKSIRTCWGGNTGPNNKKNMHKTKNGILFQKNLLLHSWIFYLHVTVPKQNVQNFLKSINVCEKNL